MKEGDHMSYPHTRKVILIYVLFLLFLGTTAQAQTYNMANGTINTCSGTFYDPGGAAGNYTNNLNLTKLFVRMQEIVCR